MPLQKPPLLRHNHLPKHPGGVSSEQMILEDIRIPEMPPDNWYEMSDLEKQEWGKKHFTPDEWRIVEEKLHKVLMMIHIFFPFYGMILTRLGGKKIWIRTEEQRSKLQYPGSGDFNTLATDGKILYLWPQFILYHTYWEIIGPIIHEIMHCIFQHLQRGKGYDVRKRQIATDLVTNLLVNDAAKATQDLKGPMTEEDYKEMPWAIRVEPIPVGNGRFIQYFVDEQFRMPNGEVMMFEDVYQMLKDGCDAQGNTTGDSHEAWSNIDRPADDEGNINHEILKPSEVKQIILDVYASCPATTIGTMPRSLERLIDQIVSPPLPWYQILSNYMSLAPADVSWNPGDTRFDDPMPAMIDEPEMTWLITTFDTSASMSRKSISSAVAQANNLLLGYPNMKGHALFWDAEVEWDIPLDEFTKVNEKVHGGGGTRIKPQFDWIKKHELEEKTRAVVVFTDGYVNWDEVDPETLPYDVIWVFVNNHGHERMPKHPRYKYTFLEVEE